MRLHIYGPRGYYLAQVKPKGFRRWTTIKGKAGDRRFKGREQAAVVAAKSMSGNLRARVIWCGEWHDSMVVWNAEWK
jgi:hypothetical protein